MNLLLSPDFWKKGFTFTFCVFCFTIGVGKLSLKEYGIPFSFGGSLGPLLAWPLLFGTGWLFSSCGNFFREFRFPLISFFLFLAWIAGVSCFHEASADGKPTLLYFLGGLGVFFLTLCAGRDPSIQKKILLCLILGMASTVFRGGLDFFFSDGKFSVTGTDDRRLFTPFGHPNFLGAALLLILPFAWTFEWKMLSKTSGPWVGTITNGILLLGLLFSYSRSAWVGAGVSAFCFFYFYFRKQALWVLLIMGLIAGGLCFSSSSPNPESIAQGLPHHEGTHPLLSRFRSLADFKNDPNVIERIYAWKTAALMVKDHGLTGIGPGNERFKKEFVRLHDPESMLLMPHAHHVLLQITVVFGIPGLLLFLTLAGGGLPGCWRKRNSGDDFKKSLRIACLCSSAGFFIYALMDCPIFADRVSPLFWTLAGLSYNPTESFRRAS